MLFICVFGLVSCGENILQEVEPAEQEEGALETRVEHMNVEVQGAFVVGKPTTVRLWSNNTKVGAHGIKSSMGCSYNVIDREKQIYTVIPTKVGKIEIIVDYFYDKGLLSEFKEANFYYTSYDTKPSISSYVTKIPVGSSTTVSLSDFPAGSQLLWDLPNSGVSCTYSSDKSRLTATFTSPGNYTFKAKYSSGSYVSDFSIPMTIEAVAHNLLPTNNIKAIVVSTGADPNHGGYGYAKFRVTSSYPTKTSLAVTFTINIGLVLGVIEEDVTMYLPVGSSSSEYTYYTEERASPQDATINYGSGRISTPYDAYYRYVPVF